MVPKKDEQPMLSIVVTARNDNHGGNLLQRMQLFLNGLLSQAKHYNLEAELILVEWNPPPDRLRLAKALAWPDTSGSCRVRLIEVSAQLHSQFQHSDKLPLFQMIAKNVGIRRANGRFILTTNIDILFSNELISFLASRQLRAGRMYRLDRYDVPADVPMDVPIDAQLAYCRQHVLRINGLRGTRNLQSGCYHPVYPKLTWRKWFHEKRQEYGLAPITERSCLHTNGCGDFILMAREHWLALRGYPEFETYSLHLDSILCHAAHHGGAREHILTDPLRIYHIEHGVGSGWTPEGHNKLNQRLNKAGISQVTHEQFNAWAIQMRRNKQPIIFNNDSWGLAHETLPEIIIQGAVDLR
jgi:hypothetical protein